MEETKECPICFEPLELSDRPVHTFVACNHTFHVECLVRNSRMPSGGHCAYCRTFIAGELLSLMLGPYKAESKIWRKDEVRDRQRVFVYKFVQIMCMFMFVIGATQSEGTLFYNVCVGMSRYLAYVLFVITFEIPDEHHFLSTATGFRLRVLSLILQIYSLITATTFLIPLALLIGYAGCNRVEFY